jgi:hypothetical protein
VAILMLVVLVLGSLYLVVSGLSTAAAEGRFNQSASSAQTLQQAKEALIARAALDRTRPGSLPCPDLDNDGDADLLAGNDCPAYIGRLPWKTLGLPDLRDAAGERLWYALSQNFTDSDAYVINPDSQGSLTVPGITPAGGIVAIVFAPGTNLAKVVPAGSAVPPGALQDQLRSGPAGAGGNPSAVCTWGVDANCQVENYLEGQNATIDTTYERRPRCERSDCPNGVPFNDQLILVTHAELFSAVETVVAKRLETEVAPMLRSYRDRWAALGGSGFFPFAAGFMDPGVPGGPPSRDNFCGSSALSGTTPNLSRGFLPVSQAASCISWSTYAVVDTGTGSGTLDSAICGATPANQPDGSRATALTCTITYTPGTGTPNIQISATVQNAAMTLVVPLEQTKVRFANLAAPPPPMSYTGGTSWGGITGQSLIAPGHLSIGYGGALPNLGAGQKTVTITLPLYTAQVRYQETTGVDTAWFFDNEWYRNTYYAVARQRAPLVGGSCVSGGCMTVTPVPDDNKEVVLVLAGRTLPGKVRPSAVQDAYFELENDEAAGATDGTFERQPRSPAFNDKVVIVSP